MRVVRVKGNFTISTALCCSKGWWLFPGTAITWLEVSVLHPIMPLLFPTQLSRSLVLVLKSILIILHHHFSCLFWSTVVSLWGFLFWTAEGFQTLLICSSQWSAAHSFQKFVVVLADLMISVGVAYYSAEIHLLHWKVAGLQIQDRYQV
jgi:hypothetical protein